MKKKIVLFVSIIVLILGAIICILLISNSKKEENSQNSTTANDIYYVDENGELHGPSMDNSSNQINNIQNNNNNQSNNIDTHNNNNNSINNQENNNNINNGYGENNYRQNEDFVSPIFNYYCMGDYKLVGTKCVYYLESNALERPYCSEGNLKNGKCEVSTTIDITNMPSSAAKEHCSNLYGSGAYLSCICSYMGGTISGGPLANESICMKNKTVSKSPQIEYYCTGGLELKNNKCSKKYETDAPFKVECPDGYNLSGNKCIK